MSHIDIEFVAERFQKHLDIEENFRIIFSGKFGVGKSYFLNNFFDDRKDNYNKIIISPVNYVISANEDIFELIKADIIKELFISKKITLDTLKTNTKLQSISQKMENDPFFLLRFMSRLLSKVSPIMGAPHEILNILEEIFNTYKSAIKDDQETKTNSQTIAEYLYETNEKKGSIYEDNYITKIINYFLEQIKGNENKILKNVLIIDDFDRIDPEHIFRILNILSAHNNYMGEKNKFLFDHVIIVCDIQNIKNIFQHRYGLKVDFEGYMDKFYSTDFFHFSNLDAIINYVDIAFENTDDGSKKLIILVLSTFLKNNLISLRMLLKHRHRILVDKFVLYEQAGFKDKTPNYGSAPTFIGHYKRFYIDSNDLSILRFFKLMSIVFGSFGSFYEKFSKVTKSLDTIRYNENTDLIYFIALQEHIALKNDDDLFASKIFTFNGNGRAIQSFEYPTTKFLERKLIIQFAWSVSNKYFGNDSYFKDARVIESEESTSTTNFEVKVSSLFEVIKNIIHASLKKDFFSKAQIHFELENL